MSRESSLRVNDDPRGYQLEIARRAQEGNVIAVADTGSGKTLISVLLLKSVVSRSRATAAATGKQVAFPNLTLRPSLSPFARPFALCLFVVVNARNQLGVGVSGEHLTCDSCVPIDGTDSNESRFLWSTRCH